MTNNAAYTTDLMYKFPSGYQSAESGLKENVFLLNRDIYPRLVDDAETS